MNNVGIQKGKVGGPPGLTSILGTLKDSPQPGARNAGFQREKPKARAIDE